MQTLHISRQELHTRGGVLDRMLDSLFDTAILVDTDCRILYISASSFPDPSQRAAVVGQHISVLDQLSPFEEVLRTGQPRPDLFLELHGRPCISSLFPVLDGERVIGVVGTITVRNLGRLKKVLSQLSDQAAGFRGLYQDLARVDSGYRLEDFVGESPRVADLLDKARKAAHSGESVLILGETGTGKEIIASGIHAERHGGRPLPYVTINCTAIPEQLLESELFGHEKGAFTGATEARMGKFQLAGDGDILLDEIGERCGKMGIRLVVDECFQSFLDQPDRHTMKGKLEKDPMLFLLRAFTKFYAMAGIRLGYGLCADTQLLEQMAQCGQPWGVSSLAQAAGIAALQEKEYAQKTRVLIAKERGWLRQALAEQKQRVVGGKANYLFFQTDTPELGQKMRRCGVMIRCCGNYPGLDETWYRTAVRTQKENEQLLKIMREVLA
jgi:hypothetical protein